MSKYQIQIGSEVRDMTEVEIAQRKKDVADNEARLQEQAARQVAKDAVLTKLGLSADELAALLGA